MQIAVGGCLAQKDRGRIVEKAPWVDVVFGTHNLASLPVLLERARHNREAQVEIVEALQNFPSDLPTRRESPYSAWVSVCVGCDNTCTFCIVPSLRGKRDRPPSRRRARRDPRARRHRRPRGHPARAERELLRPLVRRPVRVRQAAAGLRRDRRPRAGALHQPAPARLHRRRHRRDGRDAERHAAAAHADAVRFGRRAQGDAPLLPAGALPRASSTDVRAAMPDAAITTDIIVGFPGETEADFAQTLDVVRAARFAGAFTFQYSPRPGTPAATMADQVPKAVVQERYERLIALQDEISWDANKALVGREVEVLVSRGEGRKDGATGRVSGRARDGRLVHVAGDGRAGRPRDRRGHLRGAAPPRRRRRHPGPPAVAGAGADDRRRAEAAAHDRRAPGAWTHVEFRQVGRLPPLDLRRGAARRPTSSAPGSAGCPAPSWTAPTCSSTLEYGSVVLVPRDAWWVAAFNADAPPATRAPVRDLHRHQHRPGVGRRSR